MAEIEEQVAGRVTSRSRQDRLTSHNAQVRRSKLRK